MKRFPTFEDFRGSFTPLNLSIKPEDVKNWDQVNVSINDKKGTFRGMHYQSRYPQNKYIKVIRGSIIDYLYDLKTKQVLSYRLDKDNSELFVPNNYAHGFLTLQDNTIVTYLTEGQYDPQYEHSIPYTEIEQIKQNVLMHFEEDEIVITDKDKLGK